METNSMEILVLMAGEGQRFRKAGYSIPKPMIDVNGKSILEWTTDSVQTLFMNNSVTFAIREQHQREYDIDFFLEERYGSKVGLEVFKETTKGNLETAYITVQNKGLSKTKPILMLDSDNAYDSTNFDKVLSLARSNSPDHIVLCYFEPQDVALKWCFCSVDITTSQVMNLVEKQPLPGGKPLVGFFYWSSVELFQRTAQFVLENEQPKQGEFYMSQAVALAMANKVPVYAFESKKMVPLGTPEDVRVFQETTGSL